jgi:capsular exopolysaccharide synthesis family protein
MPEEKELRALPAPASNGTSRVPAVLDPITVYPPFAYAQPEPEEAPVALAHYLWILKRHKWRILSFVLVSVICTVVVSSRLTPIYESTATIDVDRQAPAGIVGQAANSPIDLFDDDQFLATQIKIIQSDSVLRPVARHFKLDVTETDTSTGQPAIPTARSANAPISLRGLKVTRPANTYLLLISYRSTDPDLASDVANAVAESYIQHTYDIRFRATAGLSAYMEKQIEELRAKMEKSSAALAQFEKDLSVINPEEKTSILSARLLQLNTEYTTAQADRVRQQAAFNSVKSGSMEAAQASTQGEQLRRLADHVDEAREKFATIAAQYGAGHPEYKKAHSQVAELERQLEDLKANIMNRVSLEYKESANRESMLASAVAETKAEFDQLNAHSFQYKALKQEAESDKGLYEELVRKIKEAGINSSFQNSSIRLADSARPGLLPVFPNLTMNAILAFLFSTLLAVGLALLADVLDNTVRDPEDLQRTLKTEVVGSLPVVKHWRSRLLRVHMTAKGTTVLVKYGGHNAQEAAFEEAIRTLRDSILLSDLGRRPRSLLITSATPREGKTTAAVRLAIVHSQQKRKTLLIDGDLRRPGIHQRFGIPNDRGISTVIKGEAGWREALQKSEDYPDLDILTAGPASRSAADRLGSTLEKLFAEADPEYDLIVVDSPPLLGFAEPLQMAAIVDGVVVMTLAGQTNRNAVSSVISSLKRVKANIIGVALNEVRKDMSDRYYYYGYYGKYYSKYYKPTKG